MKTFFIYIFSFFLLFFIVNSNVAQEASFEDLMEYLTDLAESSPQSAIDSSKYVVDNDLFTDDIEAARLKLFIGRQYVLQGKSELALNYLIEAENLAGARNNNDIMARAILNQGNVFWFNDNFNEALLLYKRGYELAKSLHSLELSSWALNNIGIVYSELSSYDSALYFLEKALEIRREMADSHKIATTNYNIGSVYANQSNYEMAITYYQYALVNKDRYLKNHERAHYTINLGQACTKLKRFDAAEKYLIEGTKLALSLTTKHTLKDAYGNLAELYEAKNNYKLANTYWKKQSTLKDSIYDEQLSNKLANLRVQHESEKKEQEIVLLKAQNNISQTILEKKQFQRNVLLLISVLLFIIISLAINRNRIHRKFTELLQKKVEEQTQELQLAKEEAVASSKIKSEFLGNMSHEVRTPLNAIQGFSSLIIDEEAEPKLRNYYLQMVEQNSHYLLEIFNNITDYTIFENDTVNMNYNRFVLRDLFEDLREFYLVKKDVFNEANIDFIVDEEAANDKSLLLSDYERIIQIFKYLIDNSFKFTQGGHVEIGFNYIDKGYVFYVRDTGIGIQEENKELIFERFRKIIPTEGKFYRGVGLGLSIAKLIVEKLGGKIWFESQIDQGTTFYFSIPD